MTSLMVFAQPSTKHHVYVPGSTYAAILKHTQAEVMKALLLFFITDGAPGLTC